jgi:hypothetical protein
MDNVVFRYEDKPIYIYCFYDYDDLSYFWTTTKIDSKEIELGLIEINSEIKDYFIKSEQYIYDQESGRMIINTAFDAEIANKPIPYWKDLLEKRFDLHIMKAYFYIL